MRTVGSDAGCRASLALPARVAAGVVSVLVAAVLVLVPAHAVPEQPTGVLTAQDVNAWLDGAVPALLAREAIPGAAISVVHDGAVLVERGYGMADLGSADRAPTPVDPGRTLMRVGSISKVPVAVGVMQLVERGELDLDEPITTYTDLAPEPSFNTPVTMRHLLTHTAGYEDVLRSLLTPAPAEMPSLRDYLVAAAPEQIYPPGTIPAYSNYGYALAAQILEEVSGQEAGQYLRAEVLEPAGARTATYQQPLPASLAPRAARVYPNSREDPIGFELISAWPAGSLSASAADMSALMLALLDREDSPVLGTEALTAMCAPGLSSTQLGTRAAGHQMTLGLFEQDRNGHRILGHNGDLIHSHAAFQIYPEDGTGFFIGLNGSGVNPDSAVVLRHDLLAAFADRYYPLEGAPAPVLPTSGEHAAAVAGRYISARRSESTFVRAYSPLSTLSVRAEGEALIISARTDASGRPVLLHETAPWVFEDQTGGLRVAISLEESGEVGAIGLAPAVTLLPAPAWYPTVLPTLVASLAVLAIVLVVWPVRAVIGRRSGTPPMRAPTDRWLDRAVLLAAALSVGGMCLWLVVADLLLGAEEAPALLIRSAQALTLLGILGVVPSLWRAMRGGAEPSWLRGATAMLLVAAFCGVAAVAITGGLLLPDISY